MSSSRLAILAIIITSALGGCSASGNTVAEEPVPSQDTATTTEIETPTPAEKPTPPPDAVEDFTDDTTPEGLLLEGTWSGSVDEEGADGYTVRVTFSGSRTAAEASVEYPELSCGGQWAMDSFSQRAYTFTESLTYGRSSCVDGVEIEIVAHQPEELRFRTLPPYESSATLTKDSGAPVEAKQSLDPETLGWPTDAGDATPALMIWFGAAWRVGESEVGLPDWVSCSQGTDLCIAGKDGIVGVIERRSTGYYEVAVIGADQPAEHSLLELGYAQWQIDDLLST